MSHPTPFSLHRSRIADRLTQREDGYFVGRQEELDLFARCLAGETSEWLILNVHGPAGVGKSTLIDAFRRLAERAGALQVHLDARALSASPAIVVKKLASSLGLTSGPEPASLHRCLEVIRAASGSRPVVVTCDTYEEIGPLDTWLRQALLAQLPQDSVVVIAGRQPLSGLWRELPAWRQLVRPLPLAPFDPSQTREYLALHGIEDEASVTAAWEFTRGHPLALALTAALVAQEGPGALAQAPNRPEVVAELARRWLREVPDQRLRLLVEAASTVRRFDQDLLAKLTGTPVSAADFTRLLSLSFVRGNAAGWALHDLVRSAVQRDLQWRAPAALRTMRQAALAYYGRLMALPGTEQERATALAELFYLLGDGLIRAAFFQFEEEDAGELRIAAAGPADLPELTAYVEEWRRLVNTAGDTRIELADPESRARFQHVMSPKHILREPDLIDLAGLVALGPGVVRMLKDADGRLRGISIVIPVNARTLDYLAHQPVTGPYFRRLTPDERADYADPPDRTTTWFIRLIHLRDAADNAGRAALLRDLLNLVLRGRRLLTSTPVPFYQELLRRMGFLEIDGAVHHDFGLDHPCPYMVLDLRGARMAEYMVRMARGDAAGGDSVHLDSRLAGTLADGWRTWAATQLAPTADPHLDAGPGGTGTSPALAALTPREREVTLAILDGLSNAEIARRLWVTEATVKKHLQNIFSKLGVASRTQLIKRVLTAAPFSQANPPTTPRPDGG